MPRVGVTLIAYQPLARGALSGTYPPGATPTRLRRLLLVFRRQGLAAIQHVVELPREIGAGYGNVRRRWRCAG